MTGPDEFSFEWGRIQTLIGAQLHLAPARTAKVPTIHPDDSVRRIVTKYIGYVKKTQDVAELSDGDVAELVGMTPVEDMDADTAESVRRFRSGMKIPEDDRVVICRDQRNLLALISTRNTAKRTGTFSFFNQRYMVQNLAVYGTAYQLGLRMRERCPEYDQSMIDRMVSLLVDPRLGGSKYRSMWNEDRWSPELVTVTRRVIEQLGLGGEVSWDVADAAQWREVTADQMRQIWDRVPRSEDGKFYELEGRFSTEWIATTIVGERRDSVWRGFLRDWRGMLEDEYAIEYDGELQRSHVRSQAVAHNATVFQEKKNIPVSHIAAAGTSVFARTGDFSHVEFDSDIQLDVMDKLAAEYQAVRQFLPRSRPATLRFRKTGRHNALGVYHPQVNNIAVDPRFPASFIHEYAHHLDYTLDEMSLSLTPRFREVSSRIREQLIPLTRDMSPRRFRYLHTPTEMFARSAEMYYFWRGVDTSLNGDQVRYKDPIYQVMGAVKEDITRYWDETLVRFGATLPSPDAFSHVAEVSQLRASPAVMAGRLAPASPIEHMTQPTLFEESFVPDQPEQRPTLGL